MKVNTIDTLYDLKNLREHLSETLKNATVSEIYKSPISYSFRVYVKGKTIGFYQAFH